MIVKNVIKSIRFEKRALKEAMLLEIPIAEVCREALDKEIDKKKKQNYRILIRKGNKK